MGNYEPGLGHVPAEIDALKAAVALSVPEWRAGFYHSPFGATGASMPGEGIALLSDLKIPANTDIDRLVAEITIAGDIGSLVRLGIYEATGDGGGTLIVDTGTSPGEVVGVIEKTVSVAARQYPWNAWLACAIQGAAATRPTMRYLSTTVQTPASFGRVDNASILTGAAFCGFFSAAGAFPATIAGNLVSQAGNVPKMAVRRAP